MLTPLSEMTCFYYHNFLVHFLCFSMYVRQKKERMLWYVSYVRQKYPVLTSTWKRTILAVGEVPTDRATAAMVLMSMVGLGGSVAVETLTICCVLIAGENIWAWRARSKVCQRGRWVCECFAFILSSDKWHILQFEVYLSVPAYCIH